MKSSPTTEERMLKQLENMTRLLEDMFILQAVKAGMDRTKVRKLLGVRMTRVSRISKHLPKQMNHG